MNINITSIDKDKSDVAILNYIVIILLFENSYLSILKFLIILGLCLAYR
jgi:hypothetical protein